MIINVQLVADCRSMISSKGNIMPRDPDSIPEIMAKLEEVWKKSPDLRLGQLIVNASGQREPYNVEDDAMLKGLEAFSKPWD